MLCDGSAYSKIDYPELFDVLGVEIMPDFRGCTIRGIDNNTIAPRDSTLNRKPGSY